MSARTRSKWRPRLAGVVCAALACAAVGVPTALAAWGSATPDISWYEGHEADAEYTIGRGLNARAQFYGLEQLVSDQGVTFEGKVIHLASDANFMGADLEPIGTAAHQFAGEFDGGGHTIGNFSLAPTSGEVDGLGLFGCADAGSSIHDVRIASDASIDLTRDEASDAYIANVGLVVGYSRGTVSDCASAGSITIVSAVKQADKDHPQPVRNVGGVVGECVFGVSGCTNSGPITVTETSEPADKLDPDNEQMSYDSIVGNVGGVCGFLGDEAKRGTPLPGGQIDAAPADHGSISDCANTGKLVVETPSQAGVDRFGQPKAALSNAVGGVVGYSAGSVVRCINGAAQVGKDAATNRDVGYVRAANASAAGGVVGSVRTYAFAGPFGDPSTQPTRDDGTAADPLLVADCTNYGDVYARNAVGGVCGSASTYTTVTGCLDCDKTDGYGNAMDTYVIATRWNKPAPAGIVGTTRGDVSYCANFASVFSAEYQTGENAERDRLVTVKDGYYASGIVGTLSYYTDPMQDNVRTTPMPAVYGCYNAGAIWAGTGMRQRGIVGQCDGACHDNLLLAGMVEGDKIAYGDSGADSEASGNVYHNTVAYAASATAAEVDKVRAAHADAVMLTSPEAVAWLNAQGDADGWGRYWARPAAADGSVDGTTNSLNNGAPILNRQYDGQVTDIASATFELAQDAAYAGNDAIPTATGTCAGQTLVQGVDFYVVPQTGATEISDGTHPYRATVVGIGTYGGTLSGAFAYGIGAGDLASCTVSVEPATYDFESQVPTAADVQVTTPSGQVVSPDEYTFAVEGDSDGNVIDAGAYAVHVSAVPGSRRFAGTVDGTYRIKPVDLMRDATIEGIEYLGTRYDWKDSTTDKADNPSTTLPYAGGTPVKPTVTKVAYKGHTLVEGTDYRVIYGNADVSDAGGQSVDANNVGVAGGTGVGSVTVRWIPGTNFISYENMYFKIVDGGQAIDIAQATVEAADAIYDGTEQRPVKVYLGTQQLVEGTDYTVEYADNVAAGTARFTVRGAGAFVGTQTGTFAIEEAPLYQVLYSYGGSGTADHPYVATVTGAEYQGSGDAFDLYLPDTVEHDGHTYAVTAIGDRAFGGRSRGDFAGTLANESKRKLRSVSIPASVTTIGAYAFGSVSTGIDASVSAVTLRGDSQLQSIGAYAFAKARGLTQLTLPASLATIGAGAFQECSALVSMTFLTTAADMPSSVASDAFYKMSGTVLHAAGSADAVRSLAEHNASPQRSANVGGNGGTNFTFAELADPQPAGSRVERLAGDAADGSAGTAAAIAKAAFPEGAATVVVARNDQYYDALAGAGLAGALDAPILLTDSASLSQACRTAIRALGARDFVILGGPSAVSGDVEAELVALAGGASHVRRVAGADVYGTSLACAEALVATDGADATRAIVVNPTSFADALSISGWAYANKVPVMLQTWGATSAERGFDAQARALLAGRHLIVCGGESAVADASVSDIDAGYERLGGQTIYDTSRVIADWELAHGMSASDVTVASAIPDYNGVDALAGAALAGRAHGVMLLAQSNPAFDWGGTDMALGFLREHDVEIAQVHVLGGPVASTPEFYAQVEEALGERTTVMKGGQPS